MSILVWADTHFQHAGVIGFCRRPYANVAEMNAGVIERWNATVKPTDTIYLVGDFGFGRDLAGIFEQLQGHKHLVIGNHDERNTAVLKLPWESQHDLVTLREDGVRAVACHYPLETWKGAHRGYLMIHGHSHGSLKRRMAHRYDVGADVHESPVLLQNLAAQAVFETFEPADHHGDA